MASKREIQLDVVRGLAIVLAIGWHFNAFVGNAIYDALMYPGRKFGWAGVDLFFVLSGFLVGRLILKEVIDTGTFNYKRFLIRRVFRLWPVLYLYVAAQMVLTNRPWGMFVPQVLFHVQNFFHTPLSTLWSLAVEEHFYLIAGLLIPLWAARTAQPRILYASLVSLILFATIARWIGLYAGASYLAIQTYTFYRVDALSCGVLLAALSVFHPQRFDRLCSRPAVLFGLTIAGACLLPRTMMDQLYRARFGYTIAMLTSASLLLAMHRRPIPSILSPVARVMAFMGVYSYSMYIWHYSTGTAGMRAAEKLLGIHDQVLLTGVRYAVAIGAAYVTTKLIEHPMMDLRDRLFPSEVKKPPAATRVAPLAAPEGT